MGMNWGPSLWKPHPALLHLLLATRALCPPLLSEEEIAEQCGRSESGHRAWSPRPGKVFSRLWTLTSGCPAGPGRSLVQASSLLGDLPWGTRPPLPSVCLFPRVGQRQCLPSLFCLTTPWSSFLLDGGSPLPGSMGALRDTG